MARNGDEPVTDRDDAAPRWQEPAGPRTKDTTPELASPAWPARQGGHPHGRGSNSEDAFRLLVENVKDYAIFMLDPTGHITTWNPGAARIKGYAADEIIGRHFSRFYPEEDVASDKPGRELEIAKATGKYEEEGLRIKKDGSTFWASVTITALYDDTGRLRGFGKVTRDITERKKAEEALLEAKEQAEQANRAKDHFLSVLSHELRTPLTPVLATVTFVEKRPDLPEELRVEIGMLRRNIELEARLVDDLLDMTRIARGKIIVHPEVVDTHALIDAALQSVRTEIYKKGLDLTVSLRAKNHHVWADPTRIQQVLTNLVQNALKFTPEGGGITVRTADEGGRQRIEVIDTGIGIDPDVLPRLFIPFEQGERTVTRQYGGLGLGLSIAKSLVDLHKGASLAARSDGPGKGATFTLMLDAMPEVEEFPEMMASPAPRAMAGAAPGAPEPRPALESPGRGMTTPSSAASPAAAAEPAREDRKDCQILLVEDHEDTRRVMARLLKSFGYAVKTAASVSEALRVAEREPIDLLVSDIGLPDGSGLDVMRFVKQRGIKGIALSGFGQEDDIRRSEEAGFEMHLVKPVNFDAFQNVIRRSLSQ